MRAVHIKPLPPVDTQSIAETRGSKPDEIMSADSWLWCSFDNFLQFMARWDSPAGVPDLTNFDPTKLQDKHEHGTTTTNPNQS